jgi:hypothetical protein
MRITKDLLLKYAQETVKSRLRGEMDIHAVYLTGSVLSDSPLLGGTTDIDMVFVHKFQVTVPHECKRLTPEVSLDIVHKLREDYDEHRQLRLDPWMGYPLTNFHILLHDTDHWLEFIQAGVSADFHRPDNVLARVNTLFDEAREHWFTLTQSPQDLYTDWLQQYLETLALAANSVAGLIGPPLTRRRFLMDFNERVQTLGVSKVLAGFIGLLGFADIQKDSLVEWTDAFENDLDFIAENDTAPVHLLSCRHRYYIDSIMALTESSSPEQALWPLLRTWLDVRRASLKPLPESEVWEKFLDALGLTSETRSQKLEALDAYLDTLELMIETWARTYES